MSSRFLHVLEDFDLIQLVNSSTHDAGHTLDVFITRNCFSAQVKVSVNPPVMSDHSAVCATAAFSDDSVTTSPPLIRRDWSSFDIDSFRTTLMNSELVVNPSDNCEDVFTMYDTTLKTLLDDAAPLKRSAVNRRRRRAPWYNAECRAIKLKTRRLEKIYRRKRTDDAKAAWRAQFSLQRSSFQRLHAEYWSSAIRECPDSRTLWRKFDSLLRQSSQVAIPFSADDIASYFSSKVDAIRLTTATAPPPVITSRAVPSLDNFDPVTDDEVAKLLSSVTSKQCALDPIPTWLVKQCADILVPVITIMANLSLSSAIFPSSQKHARVWPILKKLDMDAFELQSYRPVSNLTFISKFLERLVARRFLSHSELYQLLPRYQSAYRPHHSTETALIRVVNDILRSVDGGNVCALVLLDLSAAFDTVDHGLLLNIVSSRFGFGGPVHQWLQSYLTGRTQTVNINDQLSMPITLLCGVPQGSVLGPGPVSYTHLTLPTKRIV